MIKKLEQPAIDFFLYSYFGIIETDDEDSIILKCAQRAYMDLCRTLEFRDKDASHKEFRNAVCNVVQKNIHELLDSDIARFDEMHGLACEKIQETADNCNALGEGKKLYYGQAQKWLNMAMKYMWLLGLRQNDFARLLSVLHIPVDSYILQAVWEQDKEHDVALMAVLIEFLRYLKNLWMDIAPAIPKYDYCSSELTSHVYFPSSY